MIDPELTADLHRRTGSKTRRGCVYKHGFRKLDYVVPRCDECGEVYGKDGRVIVFWIFKKREERGGRDLCESCWRDITNPLRHFAVAKERFLELIAANDGAVPAKSKLPNDLMGAIANYHGNYIKLREACGYPLAKVPRRPLMKRPDGFWTWETLEKALRPICDALGHFPTDKMFLEDPEISPIRAQLKHFGGVAAVAKRLGVRPATLVKTNDGHYVLSHYEWLIDNLLFAHSVPHEPSPVIVARDKRRGDFRVQDTFIEIAGFSRADKEHEAYFQRLDAKRDLYSALGVSVIVIDREDFDDRRLVMEKLQPLIAAYGKEADDAAVEGAFKVSIPPSDATHQAVYPSSFGKQWPNVEPILLNLIDELWHFPTAIELQSSGNSRVIHWITDYHGGLNAVRIRMGYSPIQYPDNHWAEWSHVEELLRPVCEALGHFPTPDDFKEGRFDLPNIMTALRTHWGGNAAIAEKMGIPLRRECGLPRKRPKPPPELRFGELSEDAFDERVQQLQPGVAPQEFRGRKWAATPKQWAAHQAFKAARLASIPAGFDEAVAELRKTMPPKPFTRPKAEATPPEWAGKLNYEESMKVKRMHRKRQEASLESVIDKKGASTSEAT